MNWTKLVFNLFLLLLAGLAIYFYRFIFVYLGTAILVSFILDPLVSWFERRTIPRWFSIIIVYLIILGLLAFSGIKLFPLLSNQAQSLFAQFNGNLDAETLLTLPLLKDVYSLAQRLDASITNLQSAELLSDTLEKGIKLLSSLPSMLLENISAIVGTISFLATVPILSFFVIKDKYYFRKKLISLVPNRYYELSLILINKFDETVGRFFRAMLFEVVVVGIMATIAFSIAGVPYPFLVGAVAGLANIIPYFGPFSGWAVSALSILLSGLNPVQLLWSALAMYSVQVIDNNIVYPVVVGTTIRMHPLIVLLTVITAGWIGGILWMLISVPLVYIVFSLVKVTHDNLKAFRII
ncbi:MAG: AI-2E family transporter [Candidatus Cloacimonadota bacterium]